MKTFEHGQAMRQTEITIRQKHSRRSCLFPSSVPFFLKKFFIKPERLKTWDAEKPEEERAIKHFVGYCLLNNIKPHLKYYIPQKNFLRPFQAFDAEDWLSNYASLTFHPYWIDSGNAPVKIKMPVPSKVMLSSYQSERKILAVILNDSDIQVGVTLQFKDSWAGNAFNMFDKESEQYKIINKQLQLKLALREAKLLCID